MREVSVSYSCCSLDGLQKDIFHSIEPLILHVVFPVLLKGSKSPVPVLQSPPAVLYCLTVSCPTQIGSCCTPGPRR